MSSRGIERTVVWGARFLCLALLTLGLAGIASAGGALQAGGSQVEETRERWDRLSPAEKKVLRERFRKLQKMPAEERARLKERSKKLAKELAEVEATLGDEERAALKELDPDKRMSVLRRKVAERARTSASRLRSRMTPGERESLKTATRSERVKIIRAIRQRELTGLPDRFGKLAKEFELSEEELARVRSSSPKRQRAMLARIVRRRIEAQVRAEGLMPGVSQERWNRLRQADDAQFLRGVHAIRRRHPGFGVPRKKWDVQQRREAIRARRQEDRRRKSQGKVQTPR